MSNIDGINESPEMESIPEISETITPEASDNVNSFNELMDARTEQLNAQLESSPEVNDYVNNLTDNYSVDDILSMKEEAGDPNEMREAFQNACFGENDDISNDAKAEMIEGAKGDWEICQTENHMYDMALERLGYDPQNEQTDDFALSEASNEDSYSEIIDDDAVDETYEMNEISQEQLDDKQDTLNEFLDRNGDSVETPGIDQYLNHDVSEHSNEFSDADFAGTSEIADTDNGDSSQDGISAHSTEDLEKTETEFAESENFSNEEIALDSENEFSEFESDNQETTDLENISKAEETINEQENSPDEIDDSKIDSFDERPEADSSEDSDPEILPPDEAPDSQNEREPSILDRQAYNMDESYSNDGFSHKYSDSAGIQSETELQKQDSTLKETLSNLQTPASFEGNGLDETEQNEDRDKINPAIWSQILNNRGR